MGKKARPPIPLLSGKIIETHCHLDYLSGDELVSTISKSRDVGVDKIITIAVTEDNQAIVREIADSDPNVWCTQGLHPHEASSWSGAFGENLRSHAAHPKVLAIGEIGLDYYYEHADAKTQIAAFEGQIDVAIEHNKPVVIHTREAEEDTKTVLSSVRTSLSKKGVIHSFTSSLDLAEFCLGEGFYLGFNGIATFKNAENVREVIRATPIERILLETDAPYLTPVPYRGVPNAPFYLPFIAQTVADLKNVSVEELLSVTYQNSLDCFF
jgi:TatD DNase family protein